jgi:beta-galactosidase
MPAPVVTAITHDFHHDLVDGVNLCERQRQFRRLAPMPFGSVLIARDDMDEATIREHFRTMREIGLNSIKQFMACPRWPLATLERLALEEGLTPWWYGEGGWEPITDELLAKLGIDPGLAPDAIRNHPAMREHQRRTLAARIGREKVKLGIEVQAGLFKEKKGSVAGSYGADAELPEWAVVEFIEWLKRRYQDDLERLNRAWNMDVHRLKGPDSEERSGFQTWEEVADHDQCSMKRDYGRLRDILRFKADLKIREVEKVCEAARRRDPYEPHRTGGEMGLFLPFASRGTDMEGIARAIKETGSFYPSIHLCWHFEETFFEVARPVYMQASFVVDLNKGGWTAPWESTGGPQQTSGAKAPLFEWVRDRQPGYTVDAGVMTQLLFSYLGAGCRGAGLWCWNARQAGVEGGEYALLDRNERVCDRSLRVGAIASAANRLRDELWQAHKEPQVGILIDWDNEATWAAMAVFNRTVFKHFPVEARIGAMRTCIDASIPCEYVTATNLREGLAARYPVIFLPGFLGLAPDLLPILADYVTHGGRVVMDMPGGGYDTTGRVLGTRKGSDFELLFGCELQDLQYSGNNVTWTVNDEPVTGYTADLKVTAADVISCYGNGRPAVTECRVGRGTAVLVGWEAARACCRPGRANWQKLLAKTLLRGREPFYRCDGKPWAYRLAAPAADHYFILNEGPAADAHLTRLPFAYRRVTDVLSNETIDVGKPITIEADGGRWLRAEKG